MVAQPTGCFSLPDGFFQPAGLALVLASDVYEGFFCAASIPGNRHAFQDLLRVGIHQHTVFEDQWLRFIGVAHDHLWLARRLGDKAPFASDRETRPAASGQACGLDLGHDQIWGALECQLQALVSAMLQGRFNRVGINQSGFRQHYPHLAGARLGVIGGLAVLAAAQPGCLLWLDWAGLLLIDQNGRGAVT